jgi:predicted transcriptional regulator
MTKTPKNNGKMWSQADISSLRTMAKGTMPIASIASKLGRTEESIRSKAINENISLKVGSISAI